jgi:multiple sugar transport system permease protein/raffinose/stachyose/melibiose transport system permease protein
MKTVLLQKRFPINHWLLYFGLTIWSVASLLPLIWMFSASLQTNQEIYSGLHLVPNKINFNNYIQAWTQANFSVYFGNSIFYTITIVVGTVMISSMTACAFARLRFPGKNIFYILFLIFLFIPIPGSFIPLYVVLVKLNIIDTRIGYILPMIQSNLAVSIFILRSFFEEIPNEIEESAHIDGANYLQIYWRIALPLAKPAIATIIILTALGVWNEFPLALIVFSNQDFMPLQVGIMTFQGTFFSQYALMMAATSITTIPAILFYAIFQKSIIKGVMAGAIKG